ncbi:DUF1566 domain-containing protein [Leptospira sarikeiensis]|nr:DUF1566 domain-containing protein [Leptospira sarikeiensis]
MFDSIDFYIGSTKTFTPAVTGTTPITYSISGTLPAGLNFNTATGQISGTPTVQTTLLSFTVTATNSIDVAQDTFNVSVWDLGAVPDTGKSNCTDNSGNGASCTGQDGQYSNLPGFRSYNTPTTHPTFTNQTITLDLIRGLYWKTCAEGQTDPSCSGTPTFLDWAGASNVCTNLNTAPGYAGFTNWRLPTAKELYTLISLNSSVPLIETTYFPNTDSTVAYWTSTQFAGSGVQAYGIHFATGNSMPFNKASSLAVRCVAGQTLSAPVFMDQGNGIVLEENTQLYIQKCNNGETYSAGACGSGANSIDWDTAVAICNSFNMNAFTWRLPNLNELHLLVDYSDSTDPRVYSIFNTIASVGYWTSSSQGGGGTEVNAYANLTDTGEMTLQTKTNFLNFRCVSSGP